MCGIVGYVGAFRPPLERALAALRHRGPDDAGLWRGRLGEAEAGLAHARLAVLDPSPSGKQPMESADGRLRVVFNGEIYNFAELRAELERGGASFRTRTDTEVLLEGYRRWGDDVLSRLRGMFALALLDHERGRALLARDRLGIKPLYYSLAPRPLASASLGEGERAAGGGEPAPLLFASEAKGVLELLPERPGIDLRALRDYLTYLYVPYSRSIHAGLSQLPPGHRLIWEKGRVSIDRWWRLPPVERPRPRQEIVRELRSLLEETVRLHLVSDVPLGAFLSGGLDSTTLVALMARAGARPVKTFCMTFEPGAGLYDEREHAREVATRYGTDHTEIPVRPDVAELLPASVRSFDEPFGNPTALLVNALSRETRRHVTVALAGDGGDEIFLGYPRYQGAAVAALYGRLPRRARAFAAETLAPRIPESTRGRHGLRRAREFLSAGTLPPDEAYAGWVTYFTEREQAALLSPEILRATAGHDPLWHLRAALAPGDERGLVDRCQAIDLATFLPGNLLTYSDRMSMAHALEVRVPFCDHALVEFMARIPASEKLRRLQAKSLLREAVADLLPPGVRRRRKLGFNPPVGIWLNGPLRPMLDDLLSEERLRRRGIFEPAAVRRLVDEQRSGRRDRSLPLWALLHFESWAEAQESARSQAAVAG